MKKNFLIIFIAILFSCSSENEMVDFFPLSVGNSWKFNTNFYWYGGEERFIGTIEWQIVEEKSENLLTAQSIKKGINIFNNGYVSPPRIDTTEIEITKYFDFLIDSENNITFCDTNLSICHYYIDISLPKFQSSGRDSKKIEIWPLEITMRKKVGIELFDIVHLYSNGSPKGKMELIDYVIY